jgi:hypothetical protein
MQPCAVAKQRLPLYWGDFHVSFSTTKQAFDPKLWDPGDNDASMQDPGDNTPKFTIVGLLRP